MNTPVGYHDGKRHIADDRGERNPYKHLVVLVSQHTHHQQQLNERWQNGVERVANQIGNRPRAAINIARDTTGLSFQMEAE